MKKADDCIRTHTGLAMAAAVIPVPVADVGAITLIEMDMLRALTKMYGREWADNIGKQALGLGAAIGAGTAMWASAVKLVPGLGTVVGGAIQMGIAGTVCYALGKTYQAFLESGAEEINEEEFRRNFSKFRDEGKRVTEDMKQDVKDGKYSNS